MEPRHLALDYFENCNAGDLIKIEIANKIQFAIVGNVVQRSAGYSPIVVLDKDAPYLINGSSFESNTVLRYLQRFIIEPDQSAEVNLGTGALFDKCGSLILSKNANKCDAYLRVKNTNGTGLAAY